MKHVKQNVCAALVLVLSSGAWPLRAEDAKPEQEPQGPKPAYDQAAPTSDLVGYRPISESMLPVSGLTPADQVTTGRPAQLPAPTIFGGPATTMGPYALGPDDVVYIDVSGQESFSGKYVVGQDGNIQYGIVGDVPADGLTKEELSQVLAEKLKQYVRVPTVQVTIVGFNSKAIYILGMVSRPGKYAMRGDSIKIRDALIASGLMLDGAALTKVHVIKSDPSDPTYRVFNLKKVLFKGVMKDNIDLVDGDIIVVPSTLWSRVSSFIGLLTNPAEKARSVAYLAAL
jgi:polysaccharide export outer membrane protein